MLVRVIIAIVIADEFNYYFSNVPSNIVRNIPHSNISPLNFLWAHVENSFFWPFSDREEIVNPIRSQKNKSTDLMNIPVFIHTILAPLISPTVSILFNSSFSEGIFPECFKTATMIAFFSDMHAPAVFQALLFLVFGCCTVKLKIISFVVIIWIIRNVIVVGYVLVSETIVLGQFQSN